MKKLRDYTTEEFEQWFDVAASGCWEWNCGLSKGYGYIQHTDGRCEGAHRYALELYTGQRIPRGQLACHHCDNPKCVNPAHIFVGTNIDNMRDMKDKKRQPNNTGARNPNVKLTDWQVLMIRYLTRPPRRVSYADLSPLFGVSPEMISLIARGIHRQDLPLCVSKQPGIMISATATESATTRANVPTCMVTMEGRHFIVMPPS